MEEITKETPTISEVSKAENVKVKVKKPRTPAQLEAFKKCVANRKANIDKRKSSSTPSQAATSQTLTQTVVGDQSSASFAKQVEELRKQMEANNKAIEEYKERIKQEYESKYAANNSYHTHDQDVHVGMDVDEPEIARPAHSLTHSRTVHALPTNRRAGYAEDVMFYDPMSNVSNNRKRDIRGMDPYADEKQGMLEKIYARNTNAYRQNLMEQQRRTRMATEDSIQILAPRVQSSSSQQVQQSEHVQDVQPSTPSVDRWDPIENMKAMIRGDKGKYIGFNGVRLPSSVKKLRR